MEKLTGVKVLDEVVRIYVNKEGEDSYVPDLKAIVAGARTGFMLMDDASESDDTGDRYSKALMAETGIPGLMILSMATETSKSMIDKVGFVTFMATQSQEDAAIALSGLAFQTGFGEGAARKAGYATFNDALEKLSGGRQGLIDLTAKGKEGFEEWSSAAVGVQHSYLREAAAIVSATVVAIYHADQKEEWTAGSDEIASMTVMSFIQGFVSGWGFRTNRAMLDVV